ncbi:MAG: PAS domain S-box protein [Desulfobacteraceae bacterium]|nr:PAS domain S-box protein [Desulfobacteraceae bacterium]
MRIVLRNLRVRLIALLTVAIVPAIVLASYNLVKEYQATNFRIRQDTQYLTRIADEKISRLIGNAQQLVTLLGNIPPSVPQGFDFSAIMADLRSGYPNITDIIVAASDGRVIYGASSEEISGDMREAEWFHRAAEAKDFILGEFRLTSQAHFSSLILAGPRYNESGELDSVICVGIDPASFERIAASLQPPEGWGLSLSNAAGRILARYSTGAKPAPQSPPQEHGTGANLDVLSTAPRTILDADGVERVYTSSILRTNVPQGTLYISVGAPASIFSKARQNLAICLFGLALVVLFALMAMIVGSQVLILNKVDTLIVATRQLCSGNLSVRTGLSHYGGEFGQLAAAFDQMAESLEVQEIVRMRSQAALGESEQRFRTVFDWVNDAILVINHSTGAILDVNQTVCELFGYTREEALRRNVSDFSSGVTPYTDVELMEFLGRAIEEGPQLFEWNARRSSGELFWCEVSMRSAMIGSRKRLLMTLRDVTERKKSELALRESESRYRAFITNSTEGVFRLELRKPIPVTLPLDEQVGLMLRNAYLAECNDIMARIYGMRVARHMIGQRLSDVLPDSDPRSVEYLRSFVTSGYRLTDIEFTLAGRGGKNIVLLSSLVGVVENDMLVRAWGVQRNITEQKMSAEELRFLSQFNQEIISSARNGIVVYDTELNYLVWNRFMEELTGVPAKDILGKNALEVFPHLREHGIDLLLAQARAGKSCRSRDVHFTVPHTGREVWMFSTFGPHTDPDGNNIGVIEIATDIQSRKQAEEEVERLSRQRQLILDAADEAIIGLNLEGSIIFANPASAQMFGYAPHELLGQELHKLIFHARPDGFPCRDADCPMKVTIETGSPCRARDDILWRKNGEQFPAVYSSTPIIEAGKITGAVVTFKDVTEQKCAEETRAKLEAQLRQAQKMEAIGTLAGGIAHDFNNILTPIMGYCQLALSETDPESSLHRQIAQVFQSSVRARDLVKQILAFSRKGEQQRRAVQVSFIVKEALNFMRSSLPSTLEIRHEIDQDALMCSVMADPTQIHQIIMNLCTNAAHAVGEQDGTLVVKLSLMAVATDAEYPNIRPGMYLKLSVSDTGCGMDESVLQRIYEPYFTTKGASEGTGLGLSVVYGIVNTLRGTIAVRSKPGKGTTFTILLPQADESEFNIADTMPDPLSGTGRILLVDDEKSVVDVVKEVLEQMGYNVVARYSSLDALEAFQANPWRFDLVMSDQTMPQMTGIDLAKEMLKIRPNTPIVLCTGMIDTAYKERALEAGVKAFLVKPLILHELAETLKKALESNVKDLVSVIGNRPLR